MFDSSLCAKCVVSNTLRRTSSAQQPGLHCKIQQLWGSWEYKWWQMIISLNYKVVFFFVFINIGDLRQHKNCARTEPYANGGSLLRWTIWFCGHMMTRNKTCMVSALVKWKRGLPTAPCFTVSRIRYQWLLFFHISCSLFAAEAPSLCGWTPRPSSTWSKLSAEIMLSLPWSSYKDGSRFHKMCRIRFHSLM